MWRQTPRAEATEARGATRAQVSSRPAALNLLALRNIPTPCGSKFVDFPTDRPVARSAVRRIWSGTTRLTDRAQRGDEEI